MEKIAGICENKIRSLGIIDFNLKIKLFQSIKKKILLNAICGPIVKTSTQCSAINVLISSTIKNM